MAFGAGYVLAERESDETSSARPVPNRRGSIPERLNYLFATVHERGEKPFTAADVARWVQANGGQISAIYILKILRGERQKPGMDYLKHIANFFGIDPAFFWEDDPAELGGEALAFQVRLRDEPLLHSILTRAAQLPQATQKAVLDVIDSLLAVQPATPRK